MNKFIKQIDYFIKEMDKESDRACIILAASIIDELLYILFNKYLVSIQDSDDPIFDVNGPLSSFSNKINMAYRLGLISLKFSKILHWIRKIRNICAHDISQTNFNNQQIKSIINNIYESVYIVNKKIVNMIKNKKIKNKIPKTRNKFQLSCSYIIHSLQEKILKITSLKSLEEEIGLLENCYELLEETKKHNP